MLPLLLDALDDAPLGLAMLFLFLLGWTAAIGAASLVWDAWSALL